MASRSCILHHSPLNSNERKELLVGEVPTGEQLFNLSFDEFREWGVVVVGRARSRVKTCKTHHDMSPSTGFFHVRVLGSCQDSFHLTSTLFHCCCLFNCSLLRVPRPTVEIPQAVESGCEVNPRPTVGQLLMESIPATIGRFHHGPTVLVGVHVGLEIYFLKIGL